MDCPNDGTTLQMTERQGVEVDYCPDCRGVWLDKGELDKILERSQTWEGDGGGGGAPESSAKPKKSKSKSFFESIMEFGGEG
jgi:Zn-finger nucleic acid-binding protein